MQLVTEEKSLVQVLGEVSNKNIYEIPKYQREYTWTKKEWMQLFVDVTNNDEGYFLGTIIGIGNSQQSMGAPVNKYAIIDGQQRFTTLSIFLLALYNSLKDSTPLFFSKIDKQLCWATLISEFVYNKQQRLTLQTQSYNAKDFRRLLKENDLIQDDELNLNDSTESKSYKKRKIYQAYLFFKERTKEYLETEKKCDDSEKIIEDSFKLLNKFNAIKVILITVYSPSDAYILFESLNNRGIPLSAIDLIKNQLMSKCGNNKDNKNNEENEERVYNSWLSILQNLTDNHTIQERFFRQYYNAFVDDLKDPEKGISENVAQKRNMIKIYEKLIEKDHHRLLKDLENKAQLYSILINNGEDDIASPNLKNALLDLGRIEGSPSYILLLNILANRTLYNISDEQLINIVKLLTKFFVHRNFTNTPPTNKMINLFMELISDIKDKKGNAVFETIKANLLKALGQNPDEAFKKSILGDIYTNNKDTTRFILCYYEEHSATKECAKAVRDLWLRNDKGDFIYTIEHIFPEGKNIPTDWVTMIANGDSSKAMKLQEEYVHTLGNLTMTGYNSTLSNKSFSAKRDHKKEGNEVGYKNGLLLNEDLKNEDSWTIDKIKLRTEKLAKYFINEFKI